MLLAIVRLCQRREIPRLAHHHRPRRKRARDLRQVRGRQRAGHDVRQSMAPVAVSPTSSIFRPAMLCSWVGEGGGVLPVM